MRALACLHDMLIVFSFSLRSVPILFVGILERAVLSSVLMQSRAK